MFIGRPSGTCTVSVTSVKIRLPDKYFGMFLAYSQDQYGISPHTMIALAAKETFATALYPQSDNSYFIVDKEDDHFDTLSNDSLFIDGNKDGPFQVDGRFRPAAALLLRRHLRPRFSAQTEVRVNVLGEG